MYQIKCTNDGTDYILFDLRDEELTVENPKLKLETNKVGELTFTIYDTHPYFDKVKKLKSIIRVYQFKESPTIDGKVIFKGRVIEDEQDFDNAKKIECESKLAMLIDSQTPPFALENGEFKADGEAVNIGGLGVKNLFKWVIDTHNGQVEDFQKFVLDETEITREYTVNGEKKTKTVPKYCTVIDADNNDVITRSNTNYATTHNTIETKFIDLLGGYINIKYDVEKDGELVDYIEYVHDFYNYASQSIEFGENLLDISQVVSGAEFATGIIPLGKSEGDSQTTIKEKANGTYDEHGNPTSTGETLFEKVGDKIYITKWKDVNNVTHTIGEFGKITKVETWENVTTPDDLFKKALMRLKNEVSFGATITLKAVDLALADKDIESFYWQDKIKVFSRPHGITHENDDTDGATYLLEKIDIDLLEPKNTEIVLGKTWRTLTDVTLGAGKTAGNIQTTVNKVIADYTTNEQVKEISRGEAETAVNNAIGGEIETVIETALENTSIIAQTAEEIIFEVVQNYVEKTGYEEYREDISATLQLLAEEMVLKFNTAIEEISTVDGEVQTQFQEISKYIRFIDGKIILGEVGNEITLEISNNRLSFLQNNLEVAYMSNNKLFVVNSEFLGSLKIGNFAFTPRSNGNLSLKLSTATTPTIDDEDDATQ